MTLNDGFYIYTTYLNNSGEKVQFIKGFFEIKNTNLILYDFDDSFNTLYDYCLTPFLNGPCVLNNTKVEEVYDCIEKIDLNIRFNPSIFKKEIVKINLNCGEKFYNIYRPLFNKRIKSDSRNDLIDYKPAFNDYIDSNIMNNREYYNLLNQLEILVDDLSSIFKTVAPQKDNLQVYGHSIRNIIILACTEIDAMMKNILEKNEIQSKGPYFNMNDYIKLLNPLRLKEYSISFSRYGDLMNITPFTDWNDKMPAKSLKWYTAYNSIKHDREKNFKKATLKNAIESIAAYAIVLTAQFGYRNSLWNDKVGKMLNFITEPQWSIEDFYIPRRKSDPIYLLNSIGLKYPF
jgi:hypothetical protein